MMILQQTRGALSSGDQLALDLPFAETKSLTARLGPTPTFTRASSGTFVGSNGLIQSAGNNVARFDHDPITLASRGLLIEDSRTNLILQSENHASATWSKTGGSISSVTNTAPNGSVNSNLFSEDSSTGAHRIFQANAYVAGTSYTISVFLKYAGRQFIAITHPVVASSNIGIFDIQNGIVTLAQSNITASISQYPNGWWRCSVTGTSSITASQSHLIQGSTSETVVATSYTGLNGPAFYIYGSQVEAGSFASSYIPTTTASVVRSADVCSITGAAFTSFCNQTEGTLSLKSTILGATYAGAVVLAAPDRFNCSVIIARISSTVISSAVRSNYVIQANFNSTNITSGSENRTIIAFEQNNFAASTNGSTVLTDTIGEFATNIYPLTQMHIGSDIGTRMFGWISEVKYYRRRLPNAKLQALTAP